MIEVWKDIKGYEGLYQVSNTGKVRRMKFINNKVIKNKITILKPQLRGNYLILNLSKNGKKKQFSIHRLVAQEFVKNPNNYPVVNHLDFNTLNNNAINLQWCTQKYNVNYSKCNMKGKNHIFKTTELYGITYRKNHRNYELNIKQKYYGKFKTLEEAIKRRKEVLNELNIAI